MKKCHKGSRFSIPLPKIDLKMKLTTFLLLVSLLKIHASSYSQNTKLTLKLDNVTVEQVFDEIESMSEFRFLFESEQLNLDRKVSLDVESKDIRHILRLLFNNTNVKYRTLNRQILLSRKKRDGISSLDTNAETDDEEIEQRQINGKVVDSNGVPLAGASVVEKGTVNGAQTDFDGNYSLEVADDEAILVISYIGFATKEVSVGQQTTINVTLSESTAGLEEVVVVGYGAQRKSDVTGAITSVSGDDVNITKESNALNALAGKAAGVDVSFDSNQPGSSPSILIRGRSSLNFSNQPLFVVDGIPVSGDLSDFNPNDIQSIEILKDASSAAIYGARGANGVVLITTKRGKAGKAQISYESYIGFSEPYENIDLMDSDQWVAMRLESQRAASEQEQGLAAGTLPIPTLADGLEAGQLEAFQAGINTNFQDLIFQNGLQQNHQVGISGGSEKVRYNVSLNYFQQEGIVKNAEYERLTMRTNLDMNVTDKLKVGLSQQISFADRDDLNDGSTLNFIFRNSPLTRPFEEDGVTPTTDPLDDGLIWNPLNDFVGGNYVDNNKTFRYFANIFGTYQFNDHLKYTLNIGPEFRIDRNNDFRGTLSSVNRGGLNTAQKDLRNTTSFTIENLINYNNTFNEVHTLDATFLFSAQDIKDDFTTLAVRDLPSESQTFNNLGDASEVTNRDSSLDTERWTSFMARFNYSYKSKYLFTLTGRYDGSSKLAEGNKWGFFPSGSFAWRVSQEDFLQESQTISNLKLRLGYGTVGRNPIDPFSTLGGLSRTEGSFSDSPAFGFRPNEIANPDLKWEITTTFDAGIDFGFYNNRISGSIDYYVGNTSDLLLERTIPITSGFNSVLQNVGETKNQGIEVVLSTVNVQTEDFTWSTDFNFSRNRSEIVSLLEGQGDDVGNRWFIGEQLSVFYDRVFDGIWQLDETAQAGSFQRVPGDIKLADLNGDGVLNDDDRKIIGYQDPQWIGGLTSNINYKGWDFTVALLTRQGHTIRSQAFGNNNSLFGRYNNVDVNYWTPENPSNSIPRPNANQESPKDAGVLNYFDGSYVRVRNISLGYNFNETFLDKIGLQRLRFYVTAQNPFLFTSSELIDGIDPDVANSGPTTNFPGRNYLPSPRTFIFGLSTTF